MHDELAARQRAITLRLAGRPIQAICLAVGRAADGSFTVPGATGDTGYDALTQSLLAARCRRACSARSRR
jgi:hypothetical protein